MTQRLLSLLIAALAALPLLHAQRRDLLLNDNWQFRFAHQVDKNDTRRVDLPHTWNTTDALAGKPDYKRGTGVYTRLLHVPAAWRGQRLFLRFEGANSTAHVLVNGRTAGEHRGGYGAFVIEITPFVDYGKPNELQVRVSNAELPDVMPLVGDFNFYGGIYRDIHLLLTDAACISPLDYASPGVYLVQEKVSEARADVTARVLLANAADSAVRRTLTLRIEGGREPLILQRQVCIAPHATTQAESLRFSIASPRLWNGTADPYLYRATVSLSAGGRETDRVVQPLGLRYFSVDADKGFLLNGRPLPLRGVCRHQERAEVGNALRPEHHAEDVALMLEMGANALRLAHYPQATAMYDLADAHGLIVWAEIPFVGPGGYADKGFADLESFKSNGREQLREMVRQHYNHPSICMWGIFNELKESGDNPVAYVRELHELARQEDPTRPTTAASNQSGALNFVTDLIAWNRYDGWYGASPASLADFLDATHRAHPALRIAVSEYGAGASIYQQQDSLRQPTPNSWWHPENWQTEYHVRNWEIISQRPYVWGSFVWNMFDFGAAHRTEGDRPGINDKGLVTHDRKTRKEAFYFYKANWNPEPMVRIEGHRNTLRRRAVTEVRVFANVPEVTLRVNGKEIGTLRPDRLKTCTFKDVRLAPGENLIEATAKSGKETLSDTCRWTLR